MTRTILIAAASILIATSAPAIAQRGGSTGGTASPGASEFAPGQQSRTGATRPGASQFAPGHQSRTSATRPGQSEFAPGQRARVRETMRTRTSTRTRDR